MWRSGYAAVCKTVYAGSSPAFTSTFYEYAQLRFRQVATVCCWDQLKADPGWAGLATGVHTGTRKRSRHINCDYFQEFLELPRVNLHQGNTKYEWLSCELSSYLDKPEKAMNAK